MAERVLRSGMEGKSPPIRKDFPVADQEPELKTALLMVQPCWACGNGSYHTQGIHPPHIYHELRHALRDSEYKQPFYVYLWCEGKVQTDG